MDSIGAGIQKGSSGDGAKKASSEVPFTPCRPMIAPRLCLMTTLTSTLAYQAVETAHLLCFAPTLSLACGTFMSLIQRGFAVPCI